MICLPCCVVFVLVKTSAKGKVVRNIKQCNFHSSLSKLELPSVSFWLRVCDQVRGENMKEQMLLHVYFVNVMLHKYMLLHSVTQECVSFSSRSVS